MYNRVIVYRAHAEFDLRRYRVGEYCLLTSHVGLGFSCRSQCENAVHDLAVRMLRPAIADFVGIGLYDIN